MDLIKETPEAWDELGNFRSFAYMRPLPIWIIKWAIDRRKKERIVPHSFF